jgi:hypothetical protein
MSFRSRAGSALVVMVLVALACAATAAAKGRHRLQPLNQYVVSGRSAPRIWPAGAST